MTTHCALCHRVFWLDGCIPLDADTRFCTRCAAEECEEALSRRREAPAVEVHVDTGPGQSRS